MNARTGTRATIAVSDGQLLLADLGSHNGTRVNGQPLSPQGISLLSDGDTLVLGEVTLRMTVTKKG